MDIAEYNRSAWDAQVTKGNRWTVPVTSEEVSAARHGDWSVVLTPQRPVPSSWFPPIAGLRVLCLACGGGQQSPILAAAGADVTVLDNSPLQLKQDEMVARRDGLQIATVQGDMRDLSVFAPGSFDLIFNPCSLSFIPEVKSVFSEAYRVLGPGGTMMCGFVNPVRFIFDEAELEKGSLEVRHKLPYSDQTDLSVEEQREMQSNGEPFVFSHSIEDMIAGQLRTGFSLRDLFEDSGGDDTISGFMPVYFATLAQR